MMALVGNVELAARNLRRNPRRTLVAILTVAFGIVAFLLAGGFISWIFQEIREATIHSQLGHIQIVRPNYYAKGISDPYKYLLPENGDAEALVRKHRQKGLECGVHRQYRSVLSTNNLLIAKETAPNLI